MIDEFNEQMVDCYIYIYIYICIYIQDSKESNTLII